MRFFWLVPALVFAGCSESHLGSDQHRDGDAAADTSLGPGECVALQLTALPDPSVAACPATGTTPECAAHDVGVVVARSDSCTASWATVPFQCIEWPAVPADQELLVLTAHECSHTIEIESTVACLDRIEVSFTEYGHCSICDGQHSTMHVWSLPLDDRPIIATGKGIEPPCIP